MPTDPLPYVIVSSILGAATVIFAPAVARAARAWWKKRAEIRATRPVMKQELCGRALTVANDIEAYGRETLDAEMELLAIVLRHATFQVSHKGGYPERRLTTLRRAADIVASFVFDKWWRKKPHRPTGAMWDYIHALQRGDTEEE